MEERLFFQSGDLKIEGILDFRSNEKGVVITHPHPLYGGDMENMVVELISEVYRQKGFATLRFNFRGVGSSDGFYSDGSGEADDVCAAAEFMIEKGVKEIHLAGYSFGAWVNASIDCDKVSFARQIMVSPPAAFMDFGPPRPIKNLELVVTGSKDELAPPSEIEKYLSVWNSAAVFKVIEGADHFFWEHLKFLDEILFSNI
jgi:alpha/beta superfamily hydrolase